MKKIIITIVILVLAGIATWFYIQKNLSSRNTGEADTVVDFEEVSVVRTNGDKPWPIEVPINIDVKYPKITLSDTRATERINKDIKNTLEEIKEELGDWDALEIGTPVDQDMIETYGQGGPVGESRDVSYKIYDVYHGVFSVEFRASSYSLGATHPNGYTITRTYDISTGERMLLNKFIQTDKVAYNKLATLIRNELYNNHKEQLGDNFDKSWVEEGTDPKKPENFENFLIKKDGLMFIFDQYQIAPYVAGGFEVVISYDKLREVREPSSPIL